MSGSRFSADGMILVKCYICGSDIGYFPYTGFSTAICVRCQDPAKVEEKIIQELQQKEKTFTEKVVEKVIEVKEEISKVVNNIGKRRSRGK